MAKKIKRYTEAEWLNCDTRLNSAERYIFDLILTDAKLKIDGWQKEDLKM